jgi:hypothetical protein
MSGVKIDRALINQFENELDPQNPEKGNVPARVIGYGEISTVLEIGSGDSKSLAYKRVPIFQSELEVEHYEALYKEYIQAMGERIGIEVIPSTIARITNERRKRTVVYIVQEKLPPESIGNKAIRHLKVREINRLVLGVLEELSKVFDFNQNNRGKLELGIDGQISNWAIADFDPNTKTLGEKINLIYFDTSTPFTRKDGKELLEGELFLRSAPSFLVWLLRWLFLEDVMTRYYDFRKVSIDLIANFYKEQRPELVPGLVDTVNGFFAAQIRDGGFKPLSMEEIKAYYREDAMIWRLYLAFRRIDRSLHTLLGKYYPYILPGNIER